MLGTRSPHNNHPTINFPNASDSRAGGGQQGGGGAGVEAAASLDNLRGVSVISPADVGPDQ